MVTNRAFQFSEKILLKFFVVRIYFASLLFGCMSRLYVRDCDRKIILAWSGGAVAAKHIMVTEENKRRGIEEL